MLKVQRNGQTVGNFGVDLTRFKDGLDMEDRKKQGLKDDQRVSGEGATFTEMSKEQA